MHMQSLIFIDKQQPESASCVAFVCLSKRSSFAFVSLIEDINALFKHFKDISISCCLYVCSIPHLIKHQYQYPVTISDSKKLK